MPITGDWVSVGPVGLRAHDSSIRTSRLFRRRRCRSGRRRQPRLLARRCDSDIRFRCPRFEGDANSCPTCRRSDTIRLFRDAPRSHSSGRVERDVGQAAGAELLGAVAAAPQGGVQSAPVMCHADRCGGCRYLLRRPTGGVDRDTVRGHELLHAGAGAPSVFWIRAPQVICSNKPGERVVGDVHRRVCRIDARRSATCWEQPETSR